MPTIQGANMNGTITRRSLAKMMTEFAIKILKVKPDTTLACSYSDIGNETAEMKFYIKTACQLGLMGLKSNGTPDTKFNPKDNVTIAQFGTVLSRLLYDGRHNTENSKFWYTQHLLALHQAGIMDDISNPGAVERRGYIMLMLMRSVDIAIQQNNTTNISTPGGSFLENILQGVKNLFF
jgi:hypothetical protein